MSRVNLSRGVAGAAIAAVAILAAAATSSKAQEDRLLGMVEPVKAAKPYRIGYASADMNSDFFLGLAYGAVDEAKQAGVQITRIVSAGGYGKVAEQVSQLEQFGAPKLDGVIIVGAAFNGFDKVVNRLVEGGTKVVTVGAPIGAPKVSHRHPAERTKNRRDPGGTYLQGKAEGDGDHAAGSGGLRVEQAAFRRFQGRGAEVRPESGGKTPSLAIFRLKTGSNKQPISSPKIPMPITSMR